MSMFNKILARIRRRGLRNSLNYFAGRFETVRSARRSLARRGGRRADPMLQASDCVEPFDSDEALASLKRDSVFTGLRLRPGVVAQLMAEAAAAPRRDAHAGQLLEPAALDANASRPDPVLIVNCDSVAARELCLRIAHDGRLLALATNFLGRGPKRIEPRLQESLVVHADAGYRESRNQTVTFHYDVHDLDFLYVFFYLSDTTAESGAHELIRGSHTGKRWRHIFSSARQPDAEVYDAYGRQRALLIEGPAGHGFAEDTSCFHRALAPLKRSRVALQIRYS